VNDAQRRAVENEIGYEEDYIVRLNMEKQRACPRVQKELEAAILRHMETLAQLREPSAERKS